MFQTLDELGQDRGRRTSGIAALLLRLGGLFLLSILTFHGLMLAILYFD